MPGSDARPLEAFSNLRQALAPLEVKLPEAGSLRFSGDVQTVAERLSTFFESTENLKRQLTSFARFTPGAQQLQEISVCLRQGRETLRLARSAEISVRPILAYYGLSSLARALALSYGLPRSLAEMPRSHGLRAPDEYGVDMHRLRVRVKEDGLFHRLVDSLRQRTWFPISLHCKGPDIDARVVCPSGASKALHGADCTLQSLPRKIPGLEDFYYQTFNGRVRDECLNENWFTTLADARTVLAAWRRDYNESRPHSSLGGLAPNEFAASLLAWAGH